MKKVMYSFVNFCKMFIKVIVLIKNNNSTIIDIMNNVVKLDVLEKQTKKTLTPGEIKAYNRDSQQVKNDIILLLNKIEYYK